jgi:drug/metabolite transporter (DMT)-like permease
VLSIALAALSALVWGSSDYSGGKASQRAPALTVTVLSQIAGLVMLAICLLVVPGTPHTTDLIWGGAAGVAGLGGIVLLYRGLSTGAMSVVAPITAVTAAVVPMGVGLATERVPSPVQLVGTTCAIVAIGLVSAAPRHDGDRGGTSIVLLALGSGTLFGLFFALLAQSSPGSGMWPLAAVRACSISLGLLIMLVRRAAPRLPRAAVGWTAAAGIGDIGANALFLAAARLGELSVVAPIASLYPVSTVLLSLLVDKERVRPVQLAGLGLAAAALVLTTV